MNLLVDFLNENIYCHETGKISDFLNSVLHVVLDSAPSIILMIYLCKVNIFPLLKE